MPQAASVGGCFFSNARGQPLWIHVELEADRYHDDEIGISNFALAKTAIAVFALRTSGAA
jgi:hypothetical protein